MTGSRMPAAAKREVEGILKMWREIKYQLHTKHDDAIFGGYGSDFEARSRGGRPGNPTQSRAIRLATDPETRQLERLNGALERALLLVSGRQGKKAPAWWGLRMMYLGNHAETEHGKIQRAAARLGVHRGTVSRWNREFKAYLWGELRGRTPDADYISDAVVARGIAAHRAKKLNEETQLLAR